MLQKEFLCALLFAGQINWKSVECCMEWTHNYTIFYGYVQIFFSRFPFNFCLFSILTMQTCQNSRTKNTAPSLRLFLDHKTLNVQLMPGQAHSNKIKKIKLNQHTFLHSYYISTTQSSDLSTINCKAFFSPHSDIISTFTFVMKNLWKCICELFSRCILMEWEFFSVSSIQIFI